MQITRSAIEWIVITLNERNTEMGTVNISGGLSKPPENSKRAGARKAR